VRVRATRADRDLVFQDFEVVVGWGFAPAAPSANTRRKRRLEREVAREVGVAVGTAE
jgi:hypothetical protein